MNYKRVNKPTARKIYNNGGSILLLPCKVSDSAVDGSSPWIKPIEISLFICRGATFDSKVRDFEYYICNSELGYYPHYFVSEKDILIYEMCNLMCN